MPSIKDLHQAHLLQLAPILRESELLLQREGGLDGELKTSGSICENFIRQTLRRFVVPGQFRITSGFIATPPLLRDERNLPQCDILIVDRDTLPLFRFDGSNIEVVPQESVCGIIEVKRSLTKDALLKKGSGCDTGALAQIASVVRSIDEGGNLKTDGVLNRFNKYNGLHNHSSDKPLLGVIALQNKVEDFERTVSQLITDSGSLVDFVWTLDGHALLPAFKRKDGEGVYYYSHTARPSTRTWTKLRNRDFKDAESSFYHPFDGDPVWVHLTPGAGVDAAGAFARVLGVVSLMLSRVAARPLQEDQINDYYLR